MVNYKLLLFRYVEHVRRATGSDHAHDFPEPDRGALIEVARSLTLKETLESTGDADISRYFRLTREALSLPCTSFGPSFGLGGMTACRHCELLNKADLLQLKILSDIGENFSEDKMRSEIY